MKRIVTIQDISCVGKCSMTIALPVISSMGIETSVLPTALLSTHTKFNNFHFCDLTEEMNPIMEHWKQIQISFDVIYIGYLGSTKQIQIVMDFIEMFKGEGTLVILDPVMGDHGKMYSGFEPDFSTQMKKLCKTADILLPNLTEAALLTESIYHEDADEKEQERIIQELMKLGCKNVILTGISSKSDSIGAVCCTGANKTISRIEGEKINASFHGTGDLFASVVTGGMANEMNLEQAVELAVNYVRETIKETVHTIEKDKTDSKYGVCFEKTIPYLIQQVSEWKINN